jgi:hypothetical protein
MLHILYVDRPWSGRLTPSALRSQCFTPFKREPIISGRVRCRPTRAAGGDANENTAIAEITLQNFRKIDKTSEKLQDASLKNSRLSRF